MEVSRRSSEGSVNTSNFIFLIDNFYGDSL